MVPLYEDRPEAGQKLGRDLASRTYERPLILALPRGGVPVGFEIAKILDAPFDTLVVRKVGAPFSPEFAVGAVGPKDTLLIDEDALEMTHTSRDAVLGMVEKERHEMDRRRDVYRSGAYSIGFIPSTVIIVDDGVATGLSARAAILAAQATYKKAKIVFASPVCIKGALKAISRAVDVVCLAAPHEIHAVSQAYAHFDQVTDEEVVALLKSVSENREA